MTKKTPVAQRLSLNSPTGVPLASRPLPAQRGVDPPSYWPTVSRVTRFGGIRMACFSASGARPARKAAGGLARSQLGKPGARIALHSENEVVSLK